MTLKGCAPTADARVAILASAFVLLATARCANGDATLGVARVTVTGSQVTLQNDVQPILTANCAVAGCHAAPLVAPMSMEAGQTFGSLVGQASCEAPGVKRVEPGNGAASYIIRKLEGTQSAFPGAAACTGCGNFTAVGDCGAQMPFGGAPLPPPEIQLIRDWIDQGAANN